MVAAKLITDGERFRVAIVSSCPEAWGGSEELWAGAAMVLLAAGHEVRIFKTNVDWEHARIGQLRAAGGLVTELETVPALPARLRNRLRPQQQQYTRRSLARQKLRQGLAEARPHLTLVSQGSNFDGIPLAAVCAELGLRFVLLAQKAVDFFYPPWYERAEIQAVYRKAQRCFFVARHNLELTERQLGFRLPDAAVVWNPFNVPFASETPVPPDGPAGLVRLACVARLEVLDKGLDLLLQVLARPRWRARALHLTCFGRGADQAALEDLTRLLGLTTTVTFAGHVSDVIAIWQIQQVLVLPSRNEGLPLALVEAMLCGRPAVATNAGGVAELLVDGETGFLAAAATVDAFDAALERAWAARPAWPRLGAQAARHARASVPSNAAELFARELLHLAQREQL
ncbi:MAG: glycosyltransferase family 4 protein [Bacteroidota bacterium]|nr:glycosyltransferase family 4 protein [Bacteroidota bacterium]